MIKCARIRTFVVRFSRHPKHKKRAMRANRKVKTIAGRLVREVGRKLPDNHPYVFDLGI